MKTKLTRNSHENKFSVLRSAVIENLSLRLYYRNELLQFMLLTCSDTHQAVPSRTRRGSNIAQNSFAVHMKYE